MLQAAAIEAASEAKRLMDEVVATHERQLVEFEAQAKSSAVAAEQVMPAQECSWDTGDGWVGGSFCSSPSNHLFLNFDLSTPEGPQDREGAFTAAGASLHGGVPEAHKVSVWCSESVPSI